MKDKDQLELLLYRVFKDFETERTIIEQISEWEIRNNKNWREMTVKELLDYL